MTADPGMPTLPTRCMHGPRCQVARAEHALFECAALPPNALAPRRARRLAVLAADAWGLHDLRDQVAGVASELTTNALKHGRVAVRIDLRVYVEHGQLIFEVEDRSPLRPQPKPLTAARTSGTGFGLQLVADQCDEWGFEYFTTDHKRVWAAWDLPDQPEDAARREGMMTITDVPKVAYPGDRRTWTLTGDTANGPTLTDVRAWCRGTITGPWCLPNQVAQDADRALTSMLPEKIRPDVPLTVRIVRVLAGRDSVVTVVVDDEAMRLLPSPLRT